MSAVHTRPDRLPRASAVTSVVVLLRVVGAGLLATNAGIHAHLWNEGYRSIPTIGTFFLLDVIGASILALAVLGVPRRWLPVVAGLAAIVELGTVGGLILSTERSLFGFEESTRATLYLQSLYTEMAGAAVLVVLAGVVHRQVRSRAITSWW